MSVAPDPTNAPIDLLLAELRGLGVQLWLEGETLGVRAPKDVLLPPLREELRRRKPEIVAAIKARDAAPIARMPEAPSYELSHAQRRLWTLCQLDGASAAHNIPLSIRLDGPLDVDALGRAFDALVARHESLRTSFITVDGEPTQTIAAAVAWSLPLRDPAAGDDAGAGGRALAAQPFDLRQAPLLRAELLRTAEQQHLLHLVIHHLIADGWSLNVLAAELTAFYNAFRRGEPSPLPPLAIHCRDHAAWQNDRLRGAAAAADRDFWLRQLAPPPPPLDVPADF